MSDLVDEAEFSFPSRFDMLNKVEETIIDAADRCGFDQTQQFAVKLALEEALTNAIKHGNQLDESKQVHITYSVSPVKLSVTIRDEGKGFVPEEVPDPTLTENLEKPSGRGVMLMKAYMTDVSFSDDGRAVTLVKERECSLPNIAKKQK